MIRRFLFSIFAGGCLFATSSPYAIAQTTSPRLQQTDLLYQGAFLAPDTGTPYDSGSFRYGGTGLTYNSSNNSLFMVGYIYDQHSAEISIPQAVNSSNLADLKRSTIIQPLRDSTEGKRSQINPTDPNSKYIGGQLVWNGKLVVSVFSYYDGSSTQSSSHFARPVNLATPGQVAGPVRVGSQYPGFVSGYMTLVPAEWQAAFGGPALTGNCCLAIAGVQSNGPAASVFNPSQIGAQNPVPAVPLVGYPATHPLGDYGTQNPSYNGSTNITGLVFPSGSRSVLFFGRHGTGDFCYGVGVSDPAKHEKVLCNGENCCYDPADGSKGTHGYPYETQIWAYDASDLLAVKNGTKEQYEPRPYAIWNLQLPFASGQKLLGGAAYDPASQRVFISQLYGEDTAPVIHVFKVNLSVSPPTDTTPPGAPKNLRAGG